MTERKSDEQNVHNGSVTVLCAAGYNLRWLLRAVARLGLGWFFALCALLQGLLLSVAIRRPGPAALPTCC